MDSSISREGKCLTSGPGEMSENRISLDAVRYDTSTGLVPVIVQDAKSNEVLMQAYANREALKRTLATGQAWFWSRSRSNYWHKGATSGNTQAVVDVRLDCDGDSVLYRVHPEGPACHTGEVSCFSQSIIPQENVSISVPPLRSIAETLPENQRPTDSLPDLDLQSLSSEMLSQLWELIEQRYEYRPQGSYTTYLFSQGVDKIAKKVGEEASEVVIAAKNAKWHGSVGQDELIRESADLLFHLLVLWKDAGIRPQHVLAALQDKLPPLSNCAIP